MVKITLSNTLDIHIESQDRQYYYDLKEFFSYFVPGYQFMPAYQNSSWDGRVSLFNFGKKTLPYGLLMDVIKFHMKNFKTEPLEIAPEVKKIFSGPKLKPVYDLKYYPHDYQLDCIQAALKHKCCIMHVSTASGKSNIIAYIIKTLLEKWPAKQNLIIVPTINLVEQFYDDMINYGMDKALLGRVHSNIKEPEKPIVISTWQSLMKNHDWLSRFHSIVLDECHTSMNVTSMEIRKILAKATNAKYRIGLTGTTPPTMLDMCNVKSYLGPLIRSYAAKELGDAGYVSQCKVLVYKINSGREFEGEYFQVREQVFSDLRRMAFIGKVVKTLGKENVLILVSLVEREGEVLKDYLAKKFPKKDVVFIYGNVKAKDREHHRKDMDIRKNKIIIATYPTFKMGVNIPSLKYIILASPMKSKITVLQSIGRILRTHASKEDGAYAIDLWDIAPYLETHGDIRLKYYQKEGFETEVKDISLQDNLI
jgi:superfamily II DNA or RNA helicase